MAYIKDIFSSNNDVFVVAEIGKNFIQSEDDRSVDEYLKNAKKLVKAAKDSNADAVKFQTHDYEDEQLNIEIISPHFKGSDRYRWTKRNTKATPLWFWQEIKKYCDELEITFFTTPMSRGGAQRIAPLEPELWKVGSGDILDFVLLDYLASLGKPIIISSGMSTLEEVDLAVGYFKKKGVQLALLHCVSKYPCPPEDLNIMTIPFFKKRYDIPIGFSDHSIGFDTAVAAANLGAKIIEKHFTLDRSLWGSDHKVSMLPGEMAEMIEKIRSGKKIDLANYGEEAKTLNEDEAVFRPIFRKSLMAGRDIEVGETIEPDMLYAMRPQVYAKGLSSENYEKVLGKKALTNLKKYDPIVWEVLE
jgi:N,N'-diacetyllegionaminate synthase